MNRGTTILSHALSVQLYRDVHPVALAELARIIEKVTPGRMELSKFGSKSSVRHDCRYQTRLSRELGQLQSGFRYLKQALFLFSHYLREESGRTRSLTHQDWLHYHYSMFVTGFVSTYDIALLLTNSVFQLGIPEERCRADSVRENTHVKNTSVYEVLRSLEKVVNRHTQSRHSYVHSGIQPELNEVVSLNFLHLQSRSYQGKSALAIVPSRLLNHIVKRPGLVLAILEKVCCALLDAFVPIYE